MANPAPRSDYSFPRMKNQEILTCISELGMFATEDYLINPDKYKSEIRKLFEQLAVICLGISRDEMSQVK